MGKRGVAMLLAVLLIIAMMPFGERAEAALIANGIFQNFTYDDNLNEEKIVITLSGGSTRSYDVSPSTYYYINKTMTTTEGYKRGMNVKLYMTNGEVIRVEGLSKTEEGAIVENSRTMLGNVTKIDPKGMYITFKPDVGVETNYYTNSATMYLKHSKVVDRSALYEGDRVKLSFETATSTVISDVEIISGNTVVKDLYKGKLRLVNTAFNRLTVANAQTFENWTFGNVFDPTLKTFTFTTNTKIFAGNKPISKHELKKYADKNMYFVTTMLNGRELVDKMIVLETNERTYNERIDEVNTKDSFVKLQYTGYIDYHPGSILIRDGRLVEPSTLTGGGSAFVITDGVTSDRYAHVINVTGDLLTSPNFGAHELYFGELSVVDIDRYKLSLDDAVRLDNNYWRATNVPTLSYSNSTRAVRNFNSSVVVLQPNIDLISYEGHYGYFYVKDGHVQAVHLLQASQSKSARTLTGSIQTIRKVAPITMNIRNVSNWSNGQWVEAGAVQNLNFEQALIVKNGEVISSAELKINDRVTLYTSSTLQVQVVIVNE